MNKNTDFKMRVSEETKQKWQEASKALGFKSLSAYVEDAVNAQTNLTPELARELRKMMRQSTFQWCADERMVAYYEWLEQVMKPEMAEIHRLIDENDGWIDPSWFGIEEG